MAIKISGVPAINDDRKGSFVTVNLGTYSDAEITSNIIRGQAVGDTVYNRDKECTMSWLGSVWTNSVVGQRESVDSFSTTSSFPTPTNCSTISAFTFDDDVVASVRNCPTNVSDLENYTFMATLKFEDPDASLWAAWSSQSDDVFTNLVGKRDRNDFSDFFFPDGYSQKQLTVTGDDGDKYYTNDRSNQTHINWKTLVYGPPHAFNALEGLYDSSEFVNLRVSKMSGNFDIKYDESTARYTFERAHYNSLNERVDENNSPTIGLVDDSKVYLGFLGSAKNGNIFDLIEAKKEPNCVEGQTMSWSCPEGKSLVGFFYVVKHLDDDYSISQPLKINPDEVDRASHLQGRQGVGNVIECKPGMNLNITVANFDDDGVLEQYSTSNDIRWSIRYAVWSVSN